MLITGGEEMEIEGTIKEPYKSRILSLGYSDGK